MTANEPGQTSNKEYLNKMNIISDPSYQKGFEVGINYFTSYECDVLPDEIEVPEIISLMGPLSHVSYISGMEDAQKFVDKLKKQE